MLAVAPLVYRIGVLSYLPRPPAPRGVEAIAKRAVEQMFENGRVEEALVAVKTGSWD